jgi:hypothetical protein
MRPPCLHCGDRLVFEPGSGWLHSNGHLYAGECFCDNEKHEYSHDNHGALICRTWRDDHVAMPDRTIPLPYEAHP